MIRSPAFPWENATLDSSHLLYYTFDLANGTNALFAVTADGTKKRITEGTSYVEHYGIEGSTIVFSDYQAGNPASVFATNDIRLADVAAEPLVRATIAAQAYANFFPAFDNRAVVYTSDAEPAWQGLFVVRVR